MKKGNIRLIPAVLIIFSLSVSTAGVFSNNEIKLGGYTNSDPNNLNIGIASYVNIGPIDLESARTYLKTVDYSDNEKILGVYSFYPDAYSKYTEEVNMMITNNGYIVTFYPAIEPASKLVYWSGSNIVYSNFATAITTISKSILGYSVDYKDIRYFDYRYPDANRMLIATQASTESVVGTYNYGNLAFNIPGTANIYEVSYSLYLKSDYYDSYNQNTANVAIDSDVMGSITGDGVVYDFYNSEIMKGRDRLFGVLGSPYAQTGGALVIIYKDPTIRVTEADNFWDFPLENLGEIKSSKVEETPIIQKTPTSRIPVSIPTTVVTETPNGERTQGQTPTPTQAPLRPSTASVNLYGEKTDVELGDNILLKLSAVSLITKPKMKVQVIIIPPSGMSVTSSEFVKSGAGQFTTTYELNPGDGRDIEVIIASNQVGNYKVTGRIVYYFGDDISSGEDHSQELDINVRPKTTGGLNGNTPSLESNSAQAPKDPGFEIISGVIVLSLIYFLRKFNKN